jgi:hypothetical protein
MAMTANPPLAPLKRAVWLAVALCAAALPTAPVQAQSPATLRHFSEPASGTGAIGFNIGDRFVGPGTLSFGRLGARRQIVLPEGEWVALAATDWRAALTGNQTVARMEVSLATVVFGRFDGNRLVTAMRYTANTQPAPTLTTGGAIGATWPDAERCGDPAPTRVFHERQQPDPFREDCVSIEMRPEPLAEAGVANVQTLRSVERLGGNVGGAAVATTISFSEMRRYGYLGIVRIDWPGADAGAEPAGAAATAMRGWATDYRKIALEGYRSDYAGKALVPLK